MALHLMLVPIILSAMSASPRPEAAPEAVTVTLEPPPRPAPDPAPVPAADPGGGGAEAEVETPEPAPPAPTPAPQAQSPGPEPPRPARARAPVRQAVIQTRVEPLNAAPTVGPAPSVGAAELIGAVLAGPPGSGGGRGSGGGAGAGARSGPGGGGPCDMARRLQDALADDAVIRSAIGRARSGLAAGRSLLLWNGDWLRSRGEAGDGLARVRQAIAVEIAFAPAACRQQSVRGLAVLALGDGPNAPRVALGGGRWRWNDLTEAERR